MKQDLNQLKNMFVQMVQANDLHMPISMENMSSAIPYFPESQTHAGGDWASQAAGAQDFDLHDSRPVIIPRKKDDFEPVELMEEQLSIDHMEKELITKALKKYNGKRRDAAEELGISERTLYRKIKQFDIEL